jgi:hypothetical protein
MEAHLEQVRVLLPKRVHISVSVVAEVGATLEELELAEEVAVEAEPLL